MGEIRDDVRLVTAGPFRVAVFRSFGSQPEVDAFARLKEWAAPGRLLDDPTGYLLFGRNDPPPRSEGDEYGYCYMLTVSPDLPLGDGTDEAELPRSTYAVTRVTLATIGERWEALYEWSEWAGRQVAGHGLEEHLTLPCPAAPDSLTLDLWLPLKPAAETSGETPQIGGRL